MIIHNNKKLNISSNITANIINKLNILYIEDEQNIRENLTKTLKLFCKNIYDLEDTSMAIEILETKKIDLIISDINLPNKNGIQFIKELRQNYEYIPVIILSAYTEKSYLLDATKLKLIDYLVKPIDFNILKNALEKVAIEIINNGNFLISFKNQITYNYIKKELLNIQNEKIDLTAQELKLLDYFITNKNYILSIEDIKAYIWEDQSSSTDSAFKNLMTKLRKKIGKETISNISGIGYKILIQE